MQFHLNLEFKILYIIQHKDFTLKDVIMKRIDLFNKKTGRKLSKIELFLDWLINSMYVALILLVISGSMGFWIYFIYKFIIFYL